MLGERRGARALLIGTGTHAPGSPLPGVPAVERNLLDLRRVLRERCGLPDTAITTLLDPPTMAAIGDAVADAVAASAERAPLLVYYAGHGLVSATGALYLAAAATDPGGTRLEHTALPFATLRRYLLDSRARPLVVVLDCCFSGRALTGLTVPEEDLAGLAEIEGGYVLTSAGRGQLALAPGGAEHTAFTGELLRTLEEGIPDGPRRLTLASLFRELSQRLPAGGFPSPHARWSARAAELALADNPGWPGEGSPREPDAEGQESVAAPPAGSPYRGLAAFGTEHEPLFFGRERVTARLAQECAARHDDQQPLLVMGASGSGKTSLLRAGLLPAAGRGELDIRGSQRWPAVLMTPGESPVRSLAGRLAVWAGEREEVLAHEIRAAPETAGTTLRQALADHYRTGLVLVVDQFEETFTRCADVGERRAFVGALLALAAGAPRALVVLSIRADFFDRLTGFEELLPALGKPFVVGPMSSEELGQAITGPARAADLVVEQELVHDLLTDLGAEGDRAVSLPLLSHALLATWHERRNGRLTRDGYRATGGLGGALAGSAERVFAGLPDDDVRDQARRLLTRLVEVDAGGRDSRRVLSVKRLMRSLPHPERARQAMEAFAADDARLVTLDDDRVELTHERLASAWPRLRGWIEADRAGLVVEQNLLDAAEAWEESGREPDRLYRGIDLDLAARRDGERPDRLSPLGREFLQASRTRAEEERRAARRRRAVRAAVSAALAVLAAVASVTAYVARENQLEAEARTRAATSRGMVLEAQARAAGDPALALRLGVAALRLDPASVQARQELVTLLDGNHYLNSLPGYSGFADGVAFDADGGLALTGTGRTATLWDLSGAAPRRRAQLSGHEDEVSRVALSADGRLAVTVASGHVRLWRPGDVRSPAAVLPYGRADDADDLALSADGRRLLVSTFRGDTLVWDVSDPGAPALAGTVRGGEGGYVSAVALGPDGRYAVIGRENGHAALWDLADPRHPRILGGPPDPTDVAPVTSAAVSSATALVSVGRTVSVRPLGTGSWIALPTDPATRPGSVAASRDGRVAAVTSASGTTLWDLADLAAPERQATIVGHRGEIRAVALSGDGARVLTGGQDRQALVWRVLAPGRSARPLGASARPFDVASVDVTADGSTALVPHDLQHAALWQPRRGAGTTLSPAVGCCRVALDAAGRIAVTGDSLTSVRLWDLPSWTPRTAFTVPPGQVPFALSGDGRTLVLYAPGWPPQAWDVASVPATRLPAPAGEGPSREPVPLSVSVSDDGSAAVAVGSQRMRVWNPRTGASRADTPTDSTRVEVSGDGRTALAASASGVYVWDLRGTPRQVGSMAISGLVNALALSRDGRTALLGGGRDTLTLWDLTDRGRPLKLWTATGEEKVSLSALALSADGSTAITGANDGRQVKKTGTSSLAGPVRGIAGAWDLSELVGLARDPVGVACRVLRDGLSASEWKTYAGGLPYRETCPR